MNYAIIEASGKQVWVQPGRFYDFNYISSEPGDIIHLNRVLLSCKVKEVRLGYPCISGSYVKAIVLKHLKGRKVTIFKMKSKKNVRIKNGHRQKLTRLLVEQII
uniref:Large ribosomal subunit protein bL21m n=1 Tax=Centroceras clavulatum TaxID=159503 RepID=A0A4D6WP59_9FLOR|nr:ribosomal protein L21 [Centroceras clavulatum]